MTEIFDSNNSEDLIRKIKRMKKKFFKFQEIVICPVYLLIAYRNFKNDLQETVILKILFSIKQQSEDNLTKMICYFIHLFTIITSS